jgi:type II secretory ATPase GspE/PulE/Tfp pilus assembly ATPase PilB-like protein
MVRRCQRWPAGTSFRLSIPSIRLDPPTDVNIDESPADGGTRGPSRDAPPKDKHVQEVSLKQRHTPVGQLLQNLGRITAEDLDAALEYKRQRGIKLGQALVELKLVTEEDLASALRKQGKVHCINLTPGIIDPEVAGELGPDRSRGLTAVAVNRIAGVTTVAMEDPGDVYTVDEVSLHLKTPVLAVHAEPSKISICIDEVFETGDDTELDALEDIVDTAGDLDVRLSVEDLPNPDDDLEGEDLDQPVINLIRRTLEEAYQARASDIHLEPGIEKFRVRFRVDGALFERLSLPKAWARPCIARLKVVASLDIAQRRLPQDGRAQAEIGGRRVDLRIATTPTLTGEGAVIRILDGGRELRDLESLDLDHSQLASMQRMLECPDGFVLATGPTGSGKTTTLYGMLKKLHAPDTKIITLEDPVENQMEGITQISTHAKIGLTFARGLRSILRQDPDVVLLGEIRDEETAAVAVQAALTGHLVLSTLHTVGAAETITRFTEMGVEPYLLADTVRGVISQRLVRRVCKSCKEEVRPSTEMLSRLGIEADSNDVFIEGKGCVECHDTGYFGRIGLYEIMGMTPAMCEMVGKGGSTKELHRAAIENGLATLREDGVRKARLGQTSLSEVLSVTARG